MKNITSTYKKLKALAVSGVMAVAVCLTACQKEKLDVRKDNRFTTTPRPLSGSRIINLGLYNQVTANGVLLTDPTYYAPTDANAGKTKATEYFPQKGLLGSSWQIPQDLFGNNNSLNLKFGIVTQGAGSLADPSGEITLPAINEAYNKPMDYYLLSTRMAPTLPSYVAVERSVSQPSKPDHFKIRIINLTATVGGTPIFPSGRQREDLVGPVTLAYADGTPVAPQTSGITFAQRQSEYVEVPYGTYQFKVLTANGRQIPGTNPTDGSNSILHPNTSTIGALTNGLSGDSKLTFAPINTYQPGGVYTIVVTPYNFTFYATTGAIVESGAYQNAFYVVNDVSAPLNTTYCRAQGANAMPGSGQVSFRVGGQALPNGANYGEASDYKNFIVGNHTIEAVNAAGTVLATSNQTFRAEQNYTMWLYPDAAGKAQILFVPNDLSGFGVNLSNNGQDASLGGLRSDYLFTKRCINLSPDNGYITFTFDNGQPAVTNLRPGVLGSGSSATNGSPFFANPFEMMAYRSTPDVVPGTWAKDIDVLKSTSFIARPALYTAAGREVPNNEPGVFTVALIGRSATGTPAADKAKFIIIKHNK